MIETELKFKIQNTESLIRALKTLSFKMDSNKIYEKITMFDNPKQIMKNTDGRIRLRVSNKKTELSYKKPIARNGIKQEIEHEVTVSDQNEILKILEMMEFYPVSSYERYRTTLIKNNIIATIDEYPFSYFLEIEGNKNKIVEVANSLKLDLNQNITDSCDTLFLKWRDKMGLDPKYHMNFNDYDR